MSGSVITGVVMERGRGSAAIRTDDTGLRVTLYDKDVSNIRVLERGGKRSSITNAIASIFRGSSAQEEPEPVQIADQEPCGERVDERQALPDGMMKGFIKVFKQEYIWGVILGEDGVDYTFNGRNVKDPGLNSILHNGEIGEVRGIKVAFRPGTLTKKDGTEKLIAEDITRLDRVADPYEASPGLAVLAESRAESYSPVSTKRKFQSMVAIDPSNTEIKSDLARLLAEANKQYRIPTSKSAAIEMYQNLINEGLVSEVILRRVADEYASTGRLQDALDLLSENEGWFSSRLDFLKAVSSACNKGHDWRGTAAAKAELADHETKPKRKLMALRDAIKILLIHDQYEQAYEYCKKWISLRDSLMQSGQSLSNTAIQKAEENVLAYAKQCAKALGRDEDPSIFKAQEATQSDVAQEKPAPQPVIKLQFSQLDQLQEEETILAARRAMKEKRPLDAEKEFSKVLEGGSSAGIASVMADYVAVCVQVDELASKALDALETHRELIDPVKYRNLSITINEKLGNKENLIPLLEEAFSEGTNYQARTHAITREISILVSLHRYSQALEACERWLALYEQCKDLSGQNKYLSDTYARMKRKSYPVIERNRALCLYQLGNKEEARRIANELIFLNPSDAMAKTILEGRVVQYDDIVSATSSENGMLDHDVEFAGAMRSGFVRHLVETIDIGSQIKKRVKDGVYIGTVRQAQETVSSLLETRTQSDKARAQTRLIVSSVVAQMLHAHPDGCPEGWNDKYVSVQSARGMASWGDSKVSIGQLDTSRMAYLYAIGELTQNEADWTRSLNCYLRSYYMGSTLSSYIETQRGENSPKYDAGVLSTNDLPDAIVPSFTIGMLDLLSALDEQPRQRDMVIRDLFNADIHLRSGIASRISLLLDEEGDCESLETFKAQVDKAATLLSARKKELASSLIKLSEAFMGSMLSEESLGEVNPDYWKNWLNGTDYERLEGLYAAFCRAQGFFEGIDFDGKADIVRSATRDLSVMAGQIEDQPTEISYDIFLPAIETCISRLATEQASLYSESQPELSWSESAPAVYTPEGDVLLQLAVSNAEGCQSARQIAIMRDCLIGKDILHAELPSDIELLKGGDTAEILLSVVPSQSASEAGSFSLQLSYTFNSQDASQNFTTKSASEELTIVVRDAGFEPLKNPYVGHVANAITAADDKMFYGRETEIADIVGKLRDEGNGRMIAHGAVVLYGQTRAGKSSLMAQIKNTASGTYGDSVLICNFGNVSDVRSDPDDPDSFMAQFLYQLLDVCCDAVESNGLLTEELDYEDLTPPYEMLDDPTHAQAIFKTKMRKLSRLLEEKDVLLVLLIDEFTYIHGLINSGEVSEHFMRFWKSLLQNYYLFAIVVGQDDMPEFMQEYENEFYSMEPRKVTYLDEASAKKLIREPLERENGKEGLFRDDAVDEVYRLTAGSAYLTMSFCARLVSYLNEKGAPIVTKGLVRDFLNKRALGPAGFLNKGDFESMLNERGHDELKAENTVLLHEIAKLAKSTRRVPVASIRCDGISQDRIRVLVDRLVNRDVLIRTKDEVEIKVKLFERWLLETMGE